MHALLEKLEAHAAGEEGYDTPPAEDEDGAPEEGREGRPGRRRGPGAAVVERRRFEAVASVEVPGLRVVLLPPEGKAGAEGFPSCPVELWVQELGAELRVASAGEAEALASARLRVGDLLAREMDDHARVLQVLLQFQRDRGGAGPQAGTGADGAAPRERGLAGAPAAEGNGAEGGSEAGVRAAERENDGREQRKGTSKAPMREALEAPLLEASFGLSEPRAPPIVDAKALRLGHVLWAAASVAPAEAVLDPDCLHDAARYLEALRASGPLFLPARPPAGGGDAEGAGGAVEVLRAVNAALAEAAGDKGSSMWGALGGRTLDVSLDAPSLTLLLPLHRASEEARTAAISLEDLRLRSGPPRAARPLAPRRSRAGAAEAAAVCGGASEQVLSLDLVLRGAWVRGAALPPAPPVGPRGRGAGWYLEGSYARERTFLEAAPISAAAAVRGAGLETEKGKEKGKNKNKLLWKKLRKPSFQTILTISGPSTP